MTPERSEFIKKCHEIQEEVQKLYIKNKTSPRVAVAVMIQLLKEYACKQENPGGALNQIAEHFNRISCTQNEL